MEHSEKETWPPLLRRYETDKKWMDIDLNKQQLKEICFSGLDRCIFHAIHTHVCYKDSQEISHSHLS